MQEKKRNLVVYFQLGFVPLFLLFLALFGWFEKFFGWKDGPLGLHYGIWFMCYFSYLILLISAVAFFIVREKSESKEG